MKNLIIKEPLEKMIGPDKSMKLLPKPIDVILLLFY